MGDKFTKKIHYGREVWVSNEIEAVRNSGCLCFHCASFFPREEKNCRMAEMNFALDRLTDMVTPVCMCPDFVEAV